MTITSFSVGARFQILDEASPTLRKILAEVRELNVAIDKARASLAGLGKSVMPVGLKTAIGDTRRRCAAEGCRLVGSK
jgi:hypothetical protein